MNQAHSVARSARRLLPVLAVILLSASVRQASPQAPTATLEGGTTCYPDNHDATKVKCQGKNFMTGLVMDPAPRIHSIDGVGPKDYDWKKQKEYRHAAWPNCCTFNDSGTGFKVPITAGEHKIAASFYFQQYPGNPSMQSTTESAPMNLTFVAEAGHIYQVDALVGGGKWIPMVMDVTGKGFVPSKVVP
ncbi:MAG: hypothetical protein WBE38_18165 [Terracidiphilus sp.]